MINSWASQHGGRYKVIHDDRRQGMTLVELLIVLVILVTFISMAWPRLATRMQKADLRQATIDLKESFAEARRASMTNGEVWAFRFSDDHSDFELAPVQNSPVRNTQIEKQTMRHLKANSYGQRKHSSDVTTSSHLPTITQHLAAGVMFGLNVRMASVDTSTKTNDGGQRDPFETIEIGESAKEDSKSNSGQTVYLFPNGRASQSNFWLFSPNSKYAVRVEVRGMTGSLVIGDVQECQLDSDKSGLSKFDSENTTFTSPRTRAKSGINP